MKSYSFPYGKDQQELTLDEHHIAYELGSRPAEILTDEVAARECQEFCVFTLTAHIWQ